MKSHDGTRERVRRSRRSWLGAAVGLLLAAPAVFAQDVGVDLAARLDGRIPSELQAEILQRIELAGSRGIPVEPLAHLTLHGVVKGRSGADVLRPGWVGGAPGSGQDRARGRRAHARGR